MSLLSYEPFCCIVDSVISQLFDTRYRNDDYRREGGRKNGHSESNQKKENLRRNTRREAQEEDERRDRKVHHGRRAGQMGKICEEGNKEKRSKRVGSWPCGYDQRNEREKKGRGWELNGTGS